MHLSAAQIDQYRRDGFLAFTDVLSPEEVQAARSGLSDLIQRIARHPAVAKKGAFWMLPDSPCAGASAGSRFLTLASN